jgi:hypothetical protein
MLYCMIMVMSESSPTINHGLEEWAERLRDLPGGAPMADTFSENKVATYARLDQLGLPHFLSTTASTDEFLADPDKFLAVLRTPRFYVSVNPSDPDLRRHRTFGLDAGGTLDFVCNVRRGYGEQYDSLMLAESATLYYGGNIVISPDKANTIYAEMVEGTHSDLVGSHKNVAFAMRRDPQTNKFEYSYEDIELRRAMFATVLKIPHEIAEDHGQGFDARGWRFHPGYYEFALTKTESGLLTPLFLDYSDKPVFQVDYRQPAPAVSGD